MTEKFPKAGHVSFSDRKYPLPEVSDRNPKVKFPELTEVTRNGERITLYMKTLSHTFQLIAREMIVLKQHVIIICPRLHALDIDIVDWSSVDCRVINLDCPPLAISAFMTDLGDLSAEDVVDITDQVVEHASQTLVGVQKPVGAQKVFGAQNHGAQKKSRIHVNVSEASSTAKGVADKRQETANVKEMSDSERREMWLKKLEKRVKLTIKPVA